MSNILAKKMYELTVLKELSDAYYKAKEGLNKMGELWAGEPEIVSKVIQDYPRYLPAFPEFYRDFCNMFEREE